MRQRKVINVAGLREEVIRVLTNKWQLTAVIACQVVVQPDAIARRKAYGKKKPTDASAKTNILAATLYDLAKHGKAEKRKSKANGTKNEYRLAQPNPEQD